jgi:O-antigen/teichoic acid export membrane protein
MNNVLTYLQRLVRTDIRYLLRGGFWTILNYSIQVGAGFISTIALANLLPKAELGTYQYILAVAGILSVCTLSGLGTAITHAVAQGNDGGLRSGFAIKLRWSITIVVLAGALSLYYLLQGNSTLGISFLLVGVTTPFIESFKLYESYLVGKQAFKETVTLGIWRKPLPLLATLLALALTDNVIILVAAYYISNALSYGLVYLATLKKYEPPQVVDQKVVTFGQHLSILRIIGVGMGHIDKVILWHLLGPVAVATFSVAQITTRYAGGFMSTLSNLTLPKIAKRDVGTLRHTLPRKVFLFSLLMAFGSIIYILLTPYFFMIVFPQYPEAIPYAQTLGLGFIFYPRGVLGQAITAHASVKLQYTLTVVVSGLKLVMLWLCVLWGGIWGAVVALLLSELLAYIVGLLFLWLPGKAQPGKNSN